MSQFGADIFDDQPPTKPPTRKGRKSSQPKASEPAATAQESAARDSAARDSTTPEGAPAASPKKRPSRRKKPAAAEQPAEADPSAHDLGAKAQCEVLSPRPEPIDPQATAAREPKQESRGRRRQSRREAPSDGEKSSAPHSERPTDLPRTARQEAPAAQRVEAARPSQPDYDDEGEGFGALPIEDSEQGPGSQAHTDGTSSRTGDDPRGRRRRRRRGRRGSRDDSAPGRHEHPNQRNAAPFGRDPQADQPHPHRERGAFPRDPSAVDIDRRDSGRGDSRDRHQHGREFDLEDDRQPRTPRRPVSDFKPATPPRPAPEPRRVAVLIDLAHLSHLAREKGSEIAYRKLHSAIAGHDEVVHAICFTTRDLPETARRVLSSQGFSIEDCGDADACAEALADQASRAEWPVDALIVVGSRKGARLPQAAGGATVETAGFDGNGASESNTRRLPSTCLFVP